MPWAVPERYVDMYNDDPLPPGGQVFYWLCVTLVSGPTHPMQPVGAPPVAWHPCEDNPSVHTNYNTSLPPTEIQSLRKGFVCSLC